MQALVLCLALGIILFTYMTLWYGLFEVTDRLDIVDSAWGLGFVLVAWAGLEARLNFGKLQVASAVLVTVWGVRLFAHLANRNWRRSRDDARYQALREAWGASVKWKAYLRIFLLQGLLILLISLPMVAIANVRTHGVSTLAYVGFAVWLLGILLETVADWQLGRFLRRRAAGSHEIMERGLWRYSRHPNYFGEIVTWWGAALVAISVRQWWGIAGAVVITLLITKVSGIPPLEKHYDGSAAYAAYRRRTSVLIPLPPRKPPVHG